MDPILYNVLENLDYFGAAVSSLYRDLDGNGVYELLVGATGDDDKYNEGGAVYILYLQKDAENPVISYQKLSLAENDEEMFGNSILACRQDFDNNGKRLCFAIVLLIYAMK